MAYFSPEAAISAIAFGLGRQDRRAIPTVQRF
jgi:hypothetical protein